jgi:hypothetical protein
MPKWANYIITGVKYSSGHISHVWISVDQGEPHMTAGQLATKSQVIAAIKNGYTVVTGKWDYEREKWLEGALVSYEKVNGVEYLRTHPDYKLSDNLENMLPLNFFGF